MTPRRVDPLLSADAQLETIGGKALSLLTMANAGLPVPPAWVIPITVCETYFAEGRCLPPGFIDEVFALLPLPSDQHPQPLRFAVRSGAAVSMPGLLQTVLNCSTREELERGIQTVLDSWQSPSAVAYRQARQLNHLTGTAVILQVMVDTDVAGVMFTRDPLRPESDTLVVEAVRGTGDALVSGIESGTRWNLSRSIGADPAPQPFRASGETGRVESDALLTTEQLHALTAYGLEIEAIFGHPVDVEWGLARGAWCFFQARPIVVPAPSPFDHEALLKQENAQLAEFRRNGDSLWVRHNLCEALPFPTPLTWSIIRRFMSGAGGYGHLYRELGFSPSRANCRKGFLELIAGQIYASPHRLPDLFCTDFPFGFDHEELRRDPSAIDRAPQRLDLDRVGPWFLLRSPWIAWTLGRARRRVEQLRRTALPTLLETTIPSYHHWLETEHQQSLASLSLAEMIQVLHRRIEGVLDRFAPALMLPGVLGAAVLEQFRQQVVVSISSEVADELSQALLRSVHIPILEEMHASIHSYHAGTLPHSEFIRQYGHRSHQEMELSEPRWSESPHTIPQRTKPDTAEPDDRRLAFLEKALAHGANGGHLQSLAESALALLPAREIGKHELLRGYALIREVCVALEQATELGGDLYELSIDELSSVATSTDAAIRGTLFKRRQAREQLRQLPHPAVIDERGLGVTPPTSSTADAWRGTPISPGIAEGPAWFPERHPSESPPLGSILVATMLPPHYLTSMALAKAMVVDQTALLSHGAILARQLGIPVVSHHQATASLHEGMTVRVDGNTGCVTIQSNSMDL